MIISDYMTKVGQQSVKASAELKSLSTKAKDNLLLSIAENISEPNPPPHDFRHELSTIEVGNIVSPVVINLNKVDVTEDSTCLVATGDSNGNCSMKAKAAEQVIECEDGKSTSADSDHSSVGNSHFSNDSKKSVDSHSLKNKHKEIENKSIN